jgi:hypothetical protein
VYGCDVRVGCELRWSEDNSVRAYGVGYSRLLLTDYQTQHFYLEVDCCTAGKSRDNSGVPVVVTECENRRLL